MNEENQRGNELESQLSQVLTELRQQRNDVLALREEVQGNNFSVSSEFKKLKTAKDLVWKFQGNKVQFEFNSELEDVIKQAIWAIENSKVDYCGELLKEVGVKIKKRNKFIRIADSSPTGWETVRHYETNPVASDSEDEAKIYKAENRALKRKRSVSRGKTATSTISRARDATSSHAPSVYPVNSFIQQPFRARPFRGYYGYSTGTSYGNVSVPSGSCFACGDFRHYRKDCPHVIKPGTSDQSMSKK